MAGWGFALLTWVRKARRGGKRKDAVASVVRRKAESVEINSAGFS